MSEVPSSMYAVHLEEFKIRKHHDMSHTTSRRAVPKFLIPSLLGLIAFAMPIPDGQGSVTLLVAYLAEAVQELLGGALPWLTVTLMTASVVGAAAFPAFPQRWKQPLLVQALFRTTPVWFGLRALGMVFGIVTVFQLGPEWLWGEDTGELILGLASLMVTVFIFASFLLPLLLNFGLMEFAGALLNKVMRPLFTVPGRASIDSLTSWVGDATIGVLLTNQQYVEGHYTKREAAVMGTTFNVVSLTFTIVIVGYLSLEHVFPAFYLTIIIAGFVAAMIVPRVPPLSRISNSYADWIQPQATDQQHSDSAVQSRGGSLLKHAWRSALQRSGPARIREIGGRGAAYLVELWAGIIPIIMAIGTLAVLVAEHTPLFTWIGAPFVPVLDFLQVPEAQLASETLFIGFADMLLPAVVASGIEAEMTRFIIGALSITQLIFMSEVGGLLLASRIPVRFHHLVAIFLLRTLITLPIIVGLAHLFY